MYTSVWTGAVISAPVMSKSLIMYSLCAVFPQTAIFPASCSALPLHQPTQLTYFLFLSLQVRSSFPPSLLGVKARLALLA